MDPGIVFINAKQKYSHLEIFDFLIFFRILETLKNDKNFEYYKGFYKGFIRDFGISSEIRNFLKIDFLS